MTRESSRRVAVWRGKAVAIDGRASASNGAGRTMRGAAAEPTGALHRAATAAAPRALLLPGDILLGAEEGLFHSTRDLARALEGRGDRPLRLEFLRGDYGRVRRVAVEIGEQVCERSSVAA